MISPGRWIRRQLLGISTEEVTVQRRGFDVRDPLMAARLERIGRTFLTGYHASLESGAISELDRALGCVELEWRGFAFEGAAMGLALVDALAPGRKTRAAALLDGPGAAHVYMVHVGIGWAFARVGRRIERWLARFDPLLRWLIIDGYGFHEGYFHAPRYLTGYVPPRLNGYALHAFDQGLGRSLWFICGGDVGRVTSAIAGLVSRRHNDLWSGVGLACVYAGGAGSEALASLRTSVGEHVFALAQGAAFAAKARERAGNPAAHTRQACEALCGMSCEDAARITDECLPSDTAPESAYELWRREIQEHFRSLATSVIAPPPAAGGGPHPARMTRELAEVAR